MKKRTLLMLPLFWALLLGGCKQGDISQSSVSGGDTTSQGGDTTSQGGDTTSQGGSETTGNAFVDMGFTAHQGWPTALVANFLSRNAITDSVPELPSVGEVYYATSKEPDSYDYFALAIPGSDRAAEYVNKLNAAGYTTKQIEKAYAGVSRNEMIGATIGYVKNYPDVPNCLYIYLTPNDAESFGLHKLEKTNGWPTTVINQYLERSGVTDPLPALPEVTSSYYASIITEGKETLMVFVPGGDRTGEYGGILTRNRFNAYGELYFNEPMTITLILTHFADSDFALIEGTMIMIMASAAE
ncbi:MAG: hypothetical protein ACOX3K_03830 [Bacilli bacterium]